MEEKKNIGQLIRETIAKKELNYTRFAEQMNMTRDNLYKIFSKNDISVDLLRRFSESLGVNFFDLLAKDYSLADVVEDTEKVRENKIKSQFLEIVPNVFRRLGLSDGIGFGAKREDGLPVPDFVATELILSFTFGETMEERCIRLCGSNNLPFQSFETITNANNQSVLLMTTPKQITMTKQERHFIDIKIEERTEEEWEEIIKFAVEVAKNRFTEYDWLELNRLKR